MIISDSGQNKMTSFNYKNKLHIIILYNISKIVGLICQKLKLKTQKCPYVLNGPNQFYLSTFAFTKINYCFIVTFCWAQQNFKC